MSRHSTPKLRKNLKRKSEEGPFSLLDEDQEKQGTGFSPKTRKCRKLPYPHLEEKENGDRSEQGGDSDAAVHLHSHKHKPKNIIDTNLARQKRRGHLRLLDKHGDHEGTPRGSMLDVISKQASKLDRSVVSSPRAGKPYICSICDKQFKYYANLKSHLEVIHKSKIDDLSEEQKLCSTADWTSIQCEVCLRDFKYASNLRTHRLVHTGQE